MTPAVSPLARSTDNIITDGLASYIGTGQTGDPDTGVIDTPVWGRVRGTAYYNEIDRFAAAWLREFIAAGHIAPGVVDERDIRDVRPDELAGFRQCHFFAGIGVWSYALRRAGWPDDHPVWTGSCPCQPFSAAGKGGGFADERHLWPAFHWLIAQRRPVVVLGEQVASKDADPWLDLVQSDLEGMDYAFGCVPVAAAGFGAPNIRERAFWMADSAGSGLTGWDRTGLGGMHWPQAPDDFFPCRLAYADDKGQPARLSAPAPTRHWVSADATGGLRDQRPLHTNGFWRDADWLLCRDPNGPRWRPVEPGTFPLADGTSQSMGLIRGSGNAINAEAATGFIEAVMDHLRASDRIAA